MIQVNLLPDVKTKYIKAEQVKHTVIIGALTAAGLAIIITAILLGIVYGTQKSKLNSLNNKTQAGINQLQSVDGLDKILTIQNQLSKLTALHDQKPVISRLFTFLPQITPSNASIANIGFKLADNTVNISGTASSLEVVNKFVDTIKFTEYSTDQDQSTTKAFSSVVLASFNASNQAVLFSINAVFDPLIFSSNNTTVNLVVPKIISTRSQTEQPDLFKEQPVIAPTTTPNVNQTQGTN
jgi:hypothetical protein